MPISTYDEEMTVVAAGRPDIQKLIKMGMLKPEDIDPETGQRRGPQSKYVFLNRREKNRETGKYEMIKLKSNMGHVENPDCKGWRIGLTPEKYWKMLEEQHHNHEFRGRKDMYAPELTNEEATLFSEWLDKHLELVADKDKEDIPKHVIVRQKAKKLEKDKEEVKKADVEEKRKPGRPKKEDSSPDAKDE